LPLGLELRAGASGTEYLLGCRTTDLKSIKRLVSQLIPGSALTPSSGSSRLPVTAAAQLQLRPASLALRTDQLEAAARAILAAANQKLAAGEAITIQILVGPRTRPVHLGDQVSDPSLSLLDALLGRRRPASTEIKRQLRDRAAAAGFSSVLRIGVASPDAGRQKALIFGVVGALSTTRSPGLSMRFKTIPPARINEAKLPWFWPLELGSTELLALLGWPLGEADLPGLPPAHPRRLRPADHVETKQRIFATSAYPGDSRTIGISIADQMMHGIAIGPSGSGKTNALLHLILADIEAGRGVCVVDPKWQLIEDILARIPEHRLNDVVVLNAASKNPIGFNPLDTTGRDPDVVVDGLLSVFAGIFGSSWGPRTDDVVSASLRTLTRTSTPDHPPTLLDFPRVLTDEAFRRPLVEKVAVDPGLKGFWDWYEYGGARAQMAAIAAPLNKVRSLLLRPALVRMLSQPSSGFRLRDVWREKKIVLVPLNEGLIGSGTASLLGSLVIADIWQATQERATEFGAAKNPGMVYVDEAPRFIHLPVGLADALAVSRSLSVGWILAAQYLGQFPPDLRDAIGMNARNKIVFATEYADASAFAKMTPDLTTDDFIALPKYHAYVNLVA
ncbi:MAG: type IV secretory system conjugative DNA transfer family protein, partial [Propionicimonas sp.]|nr:type IV secretory system conjugative DNA transfer family protein [Propionicimonas sp.]